MLKKKVLRMFAALLGAVMLLTAAGTGAVFADGEAIDGKMVTVSFTETDKSMSWFEYKDFAASKEGLDYNWYAAGDTGDSELIFCFDGSKSKKIDGITYDMNGTPTEIRYLRATWAWDAGSTNFYISADKATWVSLNQTFNAGDESYTGEVKYNDITKERYPAFYKDGVVNTGGYASYKEAVITVPEKFTVGDGTVYNTKYVKVELTGKNKGGHYTICQPTVTYKVLRRGFDVENSEMVYPSTNDLKLDFDMALSENAKEPASYTVADTNGNKAAVAAVEINDKNVASLTFASALKPYTDYIVTISDDVKTAAGNDLNEKSAKFTTGAKDFSQSGRYYIETAKEKWFDGVSIANESSTFYGRGYYLGYNASFAFLFNGNYSVTSGEDTVGVHGIPTRVKFVLSQYESSLTPVCNATQVSFYDGSNNLIKKEALLKYVTNDWKNVDEETYLIQDRWTGLKDQKDCTYKIFDIKKDNIPRNTVKIEVKLNNPNSDIRLTNVQAVWNSTDIDGGSIATVNGEIAASNTLSVKYDAKIDESSVKENDMVVFANGTPITVSNAEVSGNTVKLTLAEALKPYTAGYMLQMPALKSVEGWNIAAFTQEFTTGSEYKTVTFTDTEPSNTWLQLYSASKTDKGDSTWHGWYSAQSDAAKITIPLDGNHFKKLDGKRYKLDGVMDSIQCVIAGHGGYDVSTVEIFVSENGTDWTSIGKASKYKASGSIIAEVPNWLGQQWIKVDKSALGANARYVRFNLGKNNGILQPTITYTAPIENYEINDVTYTANDNGTTTAAGKVYFNLDGDKQTAAFTVITAAYTDGVLSDVKADTFTNVAKGSAAEFSQTVTADSAASIRTYVFESAASLKPIADMYR